MNKNDIFEIKITGLTDEGYGIGRAEGIAVFVPYALPNETVRAIIIKIYKNYAIGKLMEVISPVNQRIKAECEYFYRCGGCAFQNVLYSEELLYKQRHVEDCIKKIAKTDLKIEKIIGSENICRYRNKTQFPVSENGIGFYAPKSHNVINIGSCSIQPSETDEIITTVRNWMNEYDIKPYNELTHSGDIRHVYVRSCNYETMVVIVARHENVKHLEKLAESFGKNKKICSVMQNINKQKTNVILGNKMKLLCGREYIYDNIGDYRFKISPRSFYQVNNKQTVVLYNAAKKLADIKQSDTVWDLYCGIGTIGQYAARQAKKIIGIEIIPDAVKDAAENAKINGIENVEYYCGKAEELAEKLIKKGLKPDVVFLDPPRKGCDSKLLDTVIKSGAKRIVYISCKPSTLARDMKYLAERGYDAKKVIPVDMFPRTAHVETVCLMSRKEK